MESNTTVFEVLSDLNYSGTMYKKGSFFAAEPEAFTGLVSDKTLRIVEGAATVSEAERIVAEERARAEEAGEPVETAAPRNTWGPTEPEKASVTVREPVKPVEAEEDTVAQTGAQDGATEPVKAKYRVLLEDGIGLNGETGTIHKKDEVIELDPAKEETVYLLTNKAIELVPVEGTQEVDPAANL